MSHSLRRHLSWALAGPMLLAVLGGALAYRVATGVVGEAYDASLLNLAEGAANNVRVVDGRLVLDMPGEAERLLRTDRSDRIFYRVRSDAGEWIAGDRGLPPPEPPGPEPAASYYETLYAQVAVRGVRIHRERDGLGYYVTVAETRVKRQRAVQQVLLGFAAAAACAIAAVIVIVRHAIPSGLRPLARLTAELGRRDADELRPIDPASVPTEVRGVIVAVNALLERLSAAVGAQRDFLQNAAHELRTPLASLQVQIELLGPSPDADALARLRRSVTRTTRLANQLLALARAGAADRLMAAVVALDLAELIDDQAEEWIRRADMRRIDLGIERSGAPLVGEPTLLRELIANLMDNALKYAPERGHVTLRCHADGEAAVLEVEDDGPGVPAALHEQVFERFARLPGSAGTGSGLGLAIVREIVRAHGGQVWLERGASGRGLKACVRLPRGAPGVTVPADTVPAD